MSRAPRGVGTSTELQPFGGREEERKGEGKLSFSVYQAPADNDRKMATTEEGVAPIQAAVTTCYQERADLREHPQKTSCHGWYDPNRHEFTHLTLRWASHGWPTHSKKPTDELLNTPDTRKPAQKPREGGHIQSVLKSRTRSEPSHKTLPELYLPGFTSGYGRPSVELHPGCCFHRVWFLVALFTGKRRAQPHLQPSSRIQHRASGASSGTF